MMTAILGTGWQRQAQLGDGPFQNRVIPSPRPAALTLPRIMRSIPLAATEHGKEMLLAYTD
jgi:hypothetical protein